MDAKARIIILKGAKDHISPHQTRLKIAKAMWTTIIGLYKGLSEAEKLVLKDKLRNITMSKLDFVVSYLTKISKVKEELASVGETIPNRDLGNFSIFGFPRSWQAFTVGICALENLPNWERLRGVCVQEEIRRQLGSCVKAEEDEENFALASRGSSPRARREVVVES